MPPANKDQRERVAAIGKALRKGIATPTDTLITGDIPLLLTRLSQVSRPSPHDASEDEG
ncbi:hypothetical protein [Sphingomonas sp. CROZ-RG-20F-R02-07]|uniref:hypothetical protein n=1 Tax=Sphingomonas sp. CROZ-RG-20F-R02-07 TaxID=2914832 RepID=UPI001F5696E5|nr:hypothetical protein [Sphingomonas sp. CROZ-RG-20F-R02-07]